MPGTVTAEMLTSRDKFSAPLLVLGIETSCDESAAAIVRTSTDRAELVAQVVHSQIESHQPFGGVVPEIASRSHVEVLTRVISDCLTEAKIEPQDLDGIAVANRPGLVGALLIGVTTAKALAWAWDLPLVGVHHLEAHLEVTRRFADPDNSDASKRIDLNEPYLGVVLSGGHTDLYRVEPDGSRERLGQTQDDAIGEAFDKVASILGLPYPGGPAISKLAETGDPKAVALPRTLLAPGSLDFSFSGIKTSVLYKYRGQDARAPEPLPDAPRREDLCASFQSAVVDVVIEKVRRALDQTGLKTVIFGGGVTANRHLRKTAFDQLLTASRRSRHRSNRRRVAERVLFPPLDLSTDNGAMIAALGAVQLERGERADLFLEASPS